MNFSERARSQSSRLPASQLDARDGMPRPSTRVVHSLPGCPRRPRPGAFEEILSEEVDHKLARFRSGVWWGIADAIDCGAELIEGLASRASRRGHRALERACERSERREGRS